MVRIQHVPTQKFIEETASRLQEIKECEQPNWSHFVKTGVNVERVPTQKNWWYLRSAAMLRKVYLNHSLGVSRLRKEYGGRKRRGHKPEHKYPASGAIIRRMLQQLEGAGFLKTEKKKGRVITPKGQQFLDGIAKTIKAQ